MDQAEAIATVANDRNLKMRDMRLRAAYMYYVEGLTQNEIAERLGIGRVTVVRYLNEARRKREVRFEIESGISDCVELELKLEKQFSLKKAIVTPDSGDGATIRNLIGFSTGAYLSEILDDGMSIGVSWGKTLSRALVTLTPRLLQNASVVSLLGGIYQAREFNPSEFAWQVAATIGAECYMLTAPAIVDSP
ncbi:MAG TPA: sugar-binding domain-containing protein, partial [Pararhizobium sp.]|nr:sugar-binding domain-containing protein [Pararhizobium sp.]